MMSGEEDEIVIKQTGSPSTENVANATGDDVQVKNNDEVQIKNRRKVLRGKITRAIRRLNESMAGEEQNERRLQKILDEIKTDYTRACEIHGELYNYADGDQVSRLDQWENDLTNDVFGIEEKVEDYLTAFSSGPKPSGKIVTRAVSVRSKSSVPDQQVPTSDRSNESNATSQPTDEQSTNPPSDVQSVSDTSLTARHGVGPLPFDAWIDGLVEYSETVLSHNISELSISEALFKLEASKDIPQITIEKFNGNPLNYVDFIERFKIHIHDKPHLSDDMRMLQLKMHLIGDAERALSGLGSSGIMYATALKCLKDQFGQKSSIARACVKRLTDGVKIAIRDREALRNFSLDIVNCISIFHRIGFYSDVNSSETLRQIVRRLPDPLIISWKNTVSDIREKGQQPTIKQVSDFIRKRVRAEFDPDFGDIEVGHKLENKGKSDRRKGVHSTQVREKEIKCYVCDNGHRISECPTFIDSTVNDRFRIAKEKRLCFMCLTKGHMTAECKSKRKCDKNGCSRAHHTLLHSEAPIASGVASVLDRNGILPVIRVRFRSPNGRAREGNVLIDSGAGTTIIRREFAKFLGLQGKPERFDISVVGGEVVEQSDSRRLRFWICPLSGGEEHLIEAHDIDKTILSVPNLDRQTLRSYSHLSDIEFPHKAGSVDLILGVQYSHLHVDEEVRRGLPFEPVGKKSALGWYVLGSDSANRTSVCSVGFVERVNMEKFYECETLGVKAPDCSCPLKAVSADDRKVLEMFESSCRKEGERYVIGLPWKRDPSLLPDNYELAERRLFCLERSLQKDREKAKMYSDAIAEYVANGWAVPMTKDDVLSKRPAFYLPHHGVYRPEKQSTPLRVVFDPACQFKGVSLNSCLYKGPCLIGNLLGVLLRFREEQFAFIGDIAKMFLQINIPEPDSQVHRFLWRDMDTSKDPEIFRLVRVTFGDKPSPDMASFVMLRMAEEAREKFPWASEILSRDRYVDDLIHSCSRRKDAIEKMKCLDEVLASGSFRVKKWHYSGENGEDDKPIVPEYNSRGDSSELVNLSNEETVKALGVAWNSSADSIRFLVKEAQIGKLTKRSVLSYVSGIYDPLGLASAVTIKARIALQDLWRSKLDWDEQLPSELSHLWSGIFQDLRNLRLVEFPRSLKPVDALGSSELHVFSDASVSAYGAAAYLMWPTSNGTVVRLVSAKARVAPLRQTTIPRLELMGALIASRLAKTIVDEFKEKPEDVTLWTDSQIVLHWIQSESITLKAFVGVRVAEVQSTWEPQRWRYVPTKQNPADSLSRGLCAEELNSWMEGPPFLRLPKSEWPDVKLDAGQADVDQAEVKRPKSVCTTVPHEPVLKSCSSWSKLVRVTAYCMRFIHNARIRKGTSSLRRFEGALNKDELEKAETYWYREAQRELGDWKSRYRDLSPFCQDGIVRVGGRLRRSPLEYSQIHPVLLPASHLVSNLIIRDVHSRMGHVGPERTLAEARRKVWIVRGRNLARAVGKSCVVCRKLRQPPHSTLMADLPPERMKLFCPPFSVTGVDLFGPFLLKYGRNKSTKAWGAIFTCATVRAVHLEIVEGLSTQAFLHALRRFVSLHGWPNTIISDNGTSFVGTEKELRKLFVNGKREMTDFASLHKVTWKFITPLSPHQGGLYESLIKQAKRAIRVAVGQQVLTWNEMSTVFAEVSCLLNSRPIGYPPDNPDDLQPLTPNHFILGRASVEVPQGPFEETRNLHKRFQFVQALIHHVWKRFIRDYVPTLMKRSKWQKEGRQLKVGDVVLLVDPFTVRGKWNMGRVIAVYPGDDGVIRNVRVKTQSGEYQRSIQKCCPILELSD